MRNVEDVFHLAIPCRDLDAASAFYGPEGMGCRLARRYRDRITIDFFGDQVVCHLTTEIDQVPKMYPRHFGVTFRRLEDFERVYARAVEKKLPFFEERFVRFPKKPEEHQAFFLKDPSNNLLEFKFYPNAEMMY